MPKASSTPCNISSRSTAGSAPIRRARAAFRWRTAICSKQADAALLIDTGFGKDEPAIRGEIESLIAPGSALSLFPLRLNEFMSINNVATFAGHFNVDQCYTSNTDAALWFDFGTEDEQPRHPEFDERSPR